MGISARSAFRVLTLLCAAGATGSALAYRPPEGTPPRAARERTEARFLAAHPGVSFYRSGSVITTISGAPLSAGNSAINSAENFLAAHAGLLGIDRADLVDGSLA